MGAKQHYVPRFYLKFWSNDESKTHLSLYSFKNSMFIPSAELKNQAYEVFFYGKDNDIEKELGVLESDVSKLLNKINSENWFPRYKSKEYVNILLFTLIQLQRTARAVKDTNEGLDKLLEGILPEEEKDKYSLRMDNPAIFNLQALPDLLPIIADMACKVLVNVSDMPFITSDHPVVKYNQFLENKGKSQGIAGLGSKGLQIFYPISPTRMLLFYDSRVYKIGFRKKSILETKNKEDINNLNLLQTLNCDEQIFFNNDVNKWHIEQLVEKRKDFYKPDKNILYRYPQQKNKDGSYSELINIPTIAITTNLKLSFVKETDHAKQYKLSDYLCEVRDEKLRTRTF